MLDCVLTELDPSQHHSMVNGTSCHELDNNVVVLLHEFGSSLDPMDDQRLAEARANSLLTPEIHSRFYFRVACSFG